MYADKATEQKLVQAIKEASMRIDYSSTDDPEAILAECLTSRGLSEGFAKTAANALNKSYSVYYMSTHDDSTRGNDHPLLDSDKVKLHMCKESTPVCPKTSVPVDDTPAVVIRRIQTTQKAASDNTQAKHARTFENYPEYLGWLSNNMLKIARGYNDLTADTNMALENLYNRHNALKGADLDNYTVQCLYKQGNTDLNDMMDTLGLHQEITKSAMLGTPMMGSIKPVVPDNDTSRAICGLYNDAKIVKTATKSVTYMKEQLSGINEALQNVINTYDRDCIMGKVAASSGSKADASLYGDAVRTILVEPISTPLSALSGSIGGTAGALTNIVENSSRFRDNDLKSFSDSEVIDPILLTEDRRVKNLEAVSEVLSDPDLARYPITDLFEVTQKLIKANPQFERPDMAPMLVDTVAQTMAQGARIGLALHGATAKTISDIAKGRTNVTGNSLMDIRDTITGQKSQSSAIDGGVASMFSNALTTGIDQAGEAASKVKDSINSSIDNITKAIVDASSYANSSDERKLKKLDTKLKIQESAKKLAGPTEEEKQRAAEKQELEDIDRRKKLQTAREDEAYRNSDKYKEDQEAEKAREEKEQLVKDNKTENELLAAENKKNRLKIEESGLADQLKMLKDNPGKAEKLLNAMNMANSNIAISSGKATGYTGDVIRADNSKLDTSTLADVAKPLPSGSAKDISISGSKPTGGTTIGVSDQDYTSSNVDENQKNNQPSPGKGNGRPRDSKAYTADQLRKYLAGEIAFSRGMYDPNSEVKGKSNEWVKSLSGKLIRPEGRDTNELERKINRETIYKALNMLRDWQKQGILIDSGKSYNWQVLRDILQHYGNETGYKKK